MFERILLPVDETEDLASLIDTVAALATAFESTVTVVHFRERVLTATSDHGGETVAESAGFGRSVAGALDGRGVRTRLTIDASRPNNVGRQILQHAEREQADLIVVGGHHAHNVRERLLGDMGKVLAHGARCPLLLLPSGHQ